MFSLRSNVIRFIFLILTKNFEFIYNIRCAFEDLVKIVQSMFFSLRLSFKINDSLSRNYTINNFEQQKQNQFSLGKMKIYISFQFPFPLVEI